MSPIKPDLRHLKKPLADAAVGIARTLDEAGHQAWLVGGAVRDLALGLGVTEIDMTTDALPEEVEALFARTIPVGKAFGTIIVLWEGVSVEVTTFRSERGYSDGRRPDAVEFGATPEEDARRRDFTCNALFLAPLTGVVLDPEGGLRDLEAGVLSAIGEPGERFREDGLRLMRLARFAARLELRPAPETEEAARQEAGAIEAISRERILGELVRMLTSRRSHLAIGLLVELDILPRALPSWLDLHAPNMPPQEAASRRIEALEWLESTHVASGLAVLLDPLGGSRDAALELLKSLRPSNELLGEVQALWSLLDALEALWPMEESELDRGPDRSARLRILAHPSWPRARDVAAAFGDARSDPSDGGAYEGGHLGRMARELAAFEHGLSAEEVTPRALLSSADLKDRGVPGGPRWGELLEGAYELQLQGRLRGRDEALSWLDGQLSSAG